MITEKYDIITQWLKDPESDIYKSLEKFKQDGGEILGEGSFGIVLSKPAWNFVLKLFVRDDSYLRFVRFVIKNPRISYPKFYDIPRRLKSNFQSSTPGIKKQHTSIYVVKTEKLFQISEKEFNDIEYYVINKIPNYKSKLAPGVVSQLSRIEKQYPHIDDFQQDFFFVSREIKFAKSSDFAQRNIMKRSTGEFVMIDPFYNWDTSKFFEQ